MHELERRECIRKRITGEEFDSILYKEVLTGISKAANTLAYELVRCPDDKYALTIHEEFMNAMKSEISGYIESQMEFFKAIRNNS